MAEIWLRDDAENSIERVTSSHRFPVDAPPPAAPGAYATESITVAGTAIGLTESTYDRGGPPTRAIIAVETQPLRFRYDGGVPTASLGVLANAGDTIILNGPRAISQFLAIRTTASSASISVVYEQGVEGAVGALIITGGLTGLGTSGNPVYVNPLGATSLSDSFSAEFQGQTYTSVGAFTPDSTGSTSDILGIEASTTLVVRLVELRLWPRITTAAFQQFALAKRSTLSTGGTSATTTPAPHLSTDPAATATVRNWTAKPTVTGTLVGTVRNSRMIVPSTTAVSTIPPETIISWPFRPQEKLLQLKANSTEALYVNVLGASPTGLVIDFELTHTESTT